MSKPNWCSIHDVAYFKKGSMRGYAHPIKDEDGDPVLDEDGKPMWCNQPEDKSPTKPPEKPDMSKSDWSEKDRLQRDSIELQTAIKSTPEIVRLRHEYPDDQNANAAYNWIANKLSHWSSMGNIEKSPACRSDVRTACLTELRRVGSQAGSEAPPPDTIEPMQKAVKTNLDAAWLIESAKTLKWDILSYIKDTFEVTGGLNVALQALNDLQKEKLRTEVKRRLNEN